MICFVQFPHPGAEHSPATPSRIERRWPRAGTLPRALHRPFWTRAVPEGTPHDTGPWVFGDQMLYCYGKQVTGPVRRRTAMQNLAVGSVGATVDRPVHGMYSFVPARPATRPRFRRPPVRLATLIKPASTQSARGTRRPLPIAAVRDAWAAVRAQILAADLVLATHLSTPEYVPG